MPYYRKVWDYLAKVSLFKKFRCIDEDSTEFPEIKIYYYIGRRKVTFEKLLVEKSSVCVYLNSWLTHC